MGGGSGRAGTQAILWVALGILLWTPESAQAYVGPGAGFAFAASFAMLLFALLSALLSWLIWPVRFAIRSMRRRRALRRARVRRVVVLGLDGLDPTLAERWMGEDQLPNLSKLAEQGSFSRLRTTYPSISPVAWSSFMTGVDPARHNVFDFLNRDLRTYQPNLSTSDVRPPERSIRVGEWVIPVGRANVRNMRKSRAFWSLLGEHGVPSNVLRVPVTFPPEKYAGLLLSAMCVPDLRGTQGSFTFFTTDPVEASAPDEAAPEGTGGERHLLKFEDGVARFTLPGPPNPMRADHETLGLDLQIDVDEQAGQALLKVGKKKYKLREKEYSPWIPLNFKAGLGVKVRGIARFYITQLSPHFSLYVTPINIDPAKPALPISFPGYYSIYLASLIGGFATLGLAEDTWALNEGVIDEEAFMQQVFDHHAEREAMFFNALEKSREGFLACVFDGTDRLQHMFFRYLEEDHPANAGKDVVRFKDAILDMYRRADDMVGRVMADLGPNDLFIVMSDHGFQTFRRGVNLNSWLMRNGYLHLKEGASDSGDWFENVDWSRTKAYAFGLAGMYINQVGREAHGIVEPGEATQELKRELIKGLSGLPDDDLGVVAINEMFDNQALHPSGPYRDNGPDLIVGYARGYRASWEGAVGRVAEAVIADNTKAWSGDHCVDPRLVPGVLYCNRTITADDPGIMDLAPTILDLLGVDVPEHMTGSKLEVDTAGKEGAEGRVS